MSTTYCPRPEPSVPFPTQFHVSPQTYPLTDETNATWLNALLVAESVYTTTAPARVLLEPRHLALVLLYNDLTALDQIMVEPRCLPPLLDIPLLWTVIARAGGNPHDIGVQLREEITSPARNIIPAGGSPVDPVHSSADGLLASATPATRKIFDDAKNMIAKSGDLFIAPHHIILCLLQDPDISRLLKEFGLNVSVLRTLTKNLRRRKVTTQWTKGRWDILEQYATDLTEEAKQNRIGPIIGREVELRRLSIILSRREKRNAILLGEPGVGKTAIAEGLALRIVNRDHGIPSNLNARIFSLDMGSLLASTTCHGKMELRVKAILREIQENDEDGVPVIIYIEDLHLIMTGRKTGGAGGMDVANLMKPLLARGTLRCFGATTFADFQREMESDGSLTRRFSPIMVCEPTREETLTILRGLKPVLQAYHGLDIMDAALVQASILAHEYITSMRLPDSAVDLVDEACSMLRMNRELRPEKIERFENNLKALSVDIASLEVDRDEPESAKLLHSARAEKVKVEDELDSVSKDFKEEQARRVDVLAKTRKLEKANSQPSTTTRGRLRRLQRRKEAIDRAKQELAAAQERHVDHPIYPKRVTPSVVAQVVSEQTKIPITALLSVEKPRYLDIEETLGATVIGQPEAVKLVSDAIHLYRSGLADRTGPVASFLFTGGSGTGKSFLASELAKFLFKSPEGLVTINGSEYVNSIDLTRLIGTPTCTGNDQGGKLTECVKRTPFSVILVDNIEKACSEFIVKFRTIIDQGFLCDGDNKRVDFRNCIILMTTTVGSRHLASSGEVPDETRQLVMRDMQECFPMDFLNRLDEIIIFRTLSPNDIRALIRRALDRTRIRLEGKGYDLKIAPTVIHHLLSKVEDQAQHDGGRHVERSVEKDVMAAISSVQLGRGVSAIRLSVVADMILATAE